MNEEKGVFRLGLDLTKSVKTREVGKKGSGKFATYLSWMAALGLARDRGYDEPVVVEGDAGPWLRPVFAGAVVMTDQRVGTHLQRTYLPIQDKGYHAIPIGRIDGRDVNDKLARCRAKSIAMCTGLGLGVFAGFKGDEDGFAKAMGEVTADNIATIAPLLKTSQNAAKTKYIPWVASLAAARMADPDFFWAVEERELVNHQTGEISKELYVPMGTGYGVGVTIEYRGHKHTEWLPIMGIVEVNGKQREHQSLANPSSSDWNKAVMRCLAKNIALVTGYGLEFYAKTDFSIDDVEDGDADEGTTQSAAPTAQATVPTASDPTAAAASALVPAAAEASPAPAAPAPTPTVDADAPVMKEIAELMVATQTPIDSILKMLGGKPLEQATEPQLAAIAKMLATRRDRQLKAA